MRRLIQTAAILLVAAGTIYAATVTYPGGPRQGSMRTLPGIRHAVFNFTHEDVNTASATSEALYGVLQRIVIDCNGTETAWAVTVTDDLGVTLFSKSDCNSVELPYSYPFSLTDGTRYYHGVPVCGAITCSISDVNYAAEVQTITLNAAAERGSFWLEYLGEPTAYSNERILISDVNDPNGGTFKLTFNQQETATLAYNATAAQIEAALEALTSVYGDEIACTRGPLPRPVIVTFQNRLGGQNVGAVTLSTNDLTSALEDQTASYAISVLAEGSGLAYDANTATVQAALLALTSVEPNNIIVTGSGLDDADPNLIFTFAESLGNAAALVIRTTNLLNIGNSEVQTIEVTDDGFEADAGYWTLTYNDETTDPIPYDANAAEVRAAIQAIIADDTIAVTADDPLGYEQPVVLTFASHADVNAVTVNAKALVDTGNSETQTVAITTEGCVPDAGYFTLTYGLEETSQIAYNATAVQIRAALEALDGIDEGDVEVTADNPWSYENDIVIVFVAHEDATNLTVDPASLLDTGNDEIQTVTQAVGAVSGHWHLTYGGNTSGALSYDAAAAALNSAFDVTFGEGVIVATNVGGIAAADVVLTFSGTGVTKTDVALVTLDYADLLDGESAPVEITASETLKGKADVVPQANVTETAKGVEDEIPTVTVTETTKGVADVVPTATVTQTTQGGSSLDEVTLTLYYLENGRP